MNVALPLPLVPPSPSRLPPQALPPSPTVSVKLPFQLEVVGASSKDVVSSYESPVAPQQW